MSNDKEQLDMDNITMDQLINTASFPVYGMIGHPLSFSAYGFSYEYNGQNELRSITLYFSSPNYPYLRENFALTSLDAHTRGLIFDAKDAIHHEEGGILIDQNGVQRADDEITQKYSFLLDGQQEENQQKVKHIIRRYKRRKEQRRWSGSPLVSELELTLEEAIFKGEIHHWPQPYPLAHFLLRGEETILSGEAMGPSYEELLQLLSNLKVINNNASLLAQYQHDIDAQQRR